MNAAREKLRQRLSDHDAPVLELSKAIVFLTKIDQIASSSPLQLSRMSVADKKRNRVPSSRSGKIPSGKDAKDSDSDSQDPGSFCMQSQKIAVVGLMQRCYTSFSDQIKDLGDIHADRNSYAGSIAAAAAAAAAVMVASSSGDNNKENNDSSDAQNGANRTDFGGGIRSLAENSAGARKGGQDVWEAVGAALEYREGIAEQKLRAAYESLAMTLCGSLTSILLWHTQVCMYVCVYMYVPVCCLRTRA